MLPGYPERISVKAGFIAQPPVERNDRRRDISFDLEALPGVGRKTANVVLNVAFGQPTIAVDTHVHRGANRLGLATSTTPEQTEAALLACTPKEHLLHAHHFLILHGRYCCTARAPKCASCPMAKWCGSADQQTDMLV